MTSFTVRERAVGTRLFRAGRGWPIFATEQILGLLIRPSSATDTGVVPVPSRAPVSGASEQEHKFRLPARSGLLEDELQLRSRRFVTDAERLRRLPQRLTGEQAKHQDYFRCGEAVSGFEMVFG